MKSISLAGLGLGLALPLCARADTAADITALQQQIDAVRADYGARLQALDQRLTELLKRVAATAANPAANPAATAAASIGTTAAVTAEATTAASAATTTTADAPAVPGAQTPSTGLLPLPPGPSQGTATSGANAFNPSIALILSGQFANTSQDPARYAITGFPLPPDAEIGPGSRGFSLSETELTFAASIDPFWRGQATLTLDAENTAGVEEAFVQTTALGNGLAVKAGRFYSGIGYLNPQHTHTWDFVDSPLAYQAMLGTQYGDDGIQLTWLAPLDQYLEFGVELGRGRGFPGSDANRNAAGFASAFAHTGGDVGESHSWRAGLSLLRARAIDQRLSSLGVDGGTLDTTFDGVTRVWVLDGVWKWAPNGNATRTSLKVQGEYLRAARSGTLVLDPEGLASLGGYRARQSGWYLQGIYQFLPGWHLGLRTEQLDSGSPDYGLNADALSASSYRPTRNTLLFGVTASEFSKIRLQIARDRARQGATDTQIFVQYQMSLGAHGAHSY